MKVFLFLFLVMSVMSTGCGRLVNVPYHTLLEGLTNLNEIARLDVMPTEFISSSDLTGANEDYNHFKGKARDGELMLADLKGPGIINRFWLTGKPEDKKIRFYFDGESDPRLEFSWRELRAGYSPFDIAPISIDEQNCWHTYLPIPFRRRLLITTEDAGYEYGKSPKFYYQINWQRVPRGRTVKSFSLPMPHETRLLIEKIADRWEHMNFGAGPPIERKSEIPFGETIDLWLEDGPGMIRAISIRPDLSGIESAAERDRILRDLLLKIYWDNYHEPSVVVPLGDFFGSVWQHWRAESMFFGLHGNTFVNRFPMPFKEAARLVVENQSKYDIGIAFGIELDERPEGDYGYFHCGWRNSSVADLGRPHTVLHTEGRGRFAGCILSVVSQDRSFWVLESDERMYINGASKPFWDGTGLEDYFNSGWYYGNVFARPLHGLPNKAPFRTVQYRLHLPDPVLFSLEFLIEFERGPAHESRADYESVSFYYLSQPNSADFRSRTPADRIAPSDPLQLKTLVMDLQNFERFNDMQGQIDYINRYKETYDTPFNETLRLRRLAAEYELGDFSTEQFVDKLSLYISSANSNVRAQAEALIEIYQNENKALVQFYSNMQAELFLNGQAILRAGDPREPVFTTASLPAGKHVLAIAAAWQSYPSWVQVSVRSSEDLITGTSGHWVHAVNPRGRWFDMEYDDSEWSGFRGYSARVKGPPEEPYIFVNPDAFINTLSLTSGLRPSVPWPDRTGYVVYRHTFDVE